MSYFPYIMTSIGQIKKIREETGMSVQDIKKALNEANGDEGRALIILKERVSQVAVKKSARQVKEGVVSAYIHNTKKVGAMVELLCETDFVARNHEYQALGYDLAMHIAAMKPASVVELMEQEFIKNPEIKIKDLIQSHIAKLGENIQVGRFDLFEI